MHNPYVKECPFKSVAIIGFGTVGPGIALDYALKGLPVKIYDIDPEKFNKGMAVINTELDVLQAQHFITERTRAETLSRITNAGQEITKENLQGVGFILEAVDEKLETKQAVFQKLETYAEPGAVLASNTSALNINAIAANLSEDTRHRVIGYHVTLPAHLSTAVEVIEGKQTGAGTINKTKALAFSLGKNVIHVKGTPAGHIWNRLQCLVVSECLNMIEHGWASPEEIQYALKGALAQRWAAVDIIEAVRLGNTNTHASYMSEVIPTLPSNEERQRLVNKYLRDRNPPFEKPKEMGSPEEEAREGLHRIKERDRGIIAIARAQEAHNRDVAKRGAPDSSYVAQYRRTFRSDEATR